MTCKRCHSNFKKFWNQQNILCNDCITKLNLKIEHQILNSNTLHITLTGSSVLYNEYEQYNSQDYYIIDYLEQYVLSNILPKLKFKYINTILMLSDLHNDDYLNLIFKESDKTKLNVAISVFS